MPRVNIPITNVVAQQSVLFSPVTIDAAAVANKMMFLNDGSCVIYVTNPAAGVDCTVKITAVPDEAGRTGTSAVPTGYEETVLPGGTEVFGPYRQSWWNQTTTDIGYVYVEFTYVVPGVAANRASIGILNY